MLKVWEPFEALVKPFGTWPTWAHPTWAHRELELPVTNVEEKEDAFVVGAELPGFAPEEVKVTLENNVLTIEGKHEEKGEEEGRTFRRFNEFRRQFRLPANVNTEAIEAKQDNGLLVVTLPKIEAPKLEVKTIEVKPEPKVIEEKKEVKKEAKKEAKKEVKPEAKKAPKKEKAA
jgi:HSP20 family protein